VEYRLKELVKEQAAVKEEMQNAGHKLQEAQSLNKEMVDRKAELIETRLVEN
jgi:hypothetical protein